ncbi:hypothetical protein SLEP1_g36795 [Rubroshorea leprosula]|uniref:Uncharacterized protein n=1 Tax=Rubroshorea leprosula TaxID=152421 RepID=A0AAV5KT53_9ROSI|nr:hypothetical protein SLEP1_g36795 [Rubroshorea leprosula]
MRKSREISLCFGQLWKWNYCLRRGTVHGYCSRHCPHNTVHTPRANI